MAGELNVGTLSGTVELEDNFTSAVDLMIGRIDALDKKMGGFGTRFAEQVGAFFTAQAIFEGVSKGINLVTDSISALVVGGAEVDDIASNFEHLTEGAGRLGSTLLNELRAGTHGTVEDLQLMKLVNEDLAAGLNLTDAQFRTLADGAFALANATGVSATEALEKMNDALKTGKTRAVEALTGKIDLAAAEERYATSLGTTVEHLSAEGKLEAARVAILDNVSAATKRLGEQTDGVGEFIQQATALWNNFVDQLGRAIATSPVLIAGFEGVRDALGEAFGGKQEGLIQAIAGAVDDVLIKGVELGIMFTDVASVIGSFATGAVQGFLFIRQGIDGVVLAIEFLALGVSHLIDLLPGIDMSDEIARINGNIDSLLASMNARNDTIIKAEETEQAWGAAMGKSRAALEAIREKMVAAQKEAELHKGTQAGLAMATGDAAAAQANQNTALGTGAMVMKETAEETKKIAAAQKELATFGKSLEEVLKTIPLQVQTNVKHYLDMGASLQTVATAMRLTTAQAAAVQDAWKREAEVLKEAAKAAKEKAEALERINEQAKPLEKILASISDVVELQAKNFLEAGAAAKDVAKALGLTDTQVEAIIKSMDKGTGSADSFGNALRRGVSAAADEAAGKIRLLNGELVTLEERQRRQSLGGSQTYDLTTQAGLDQYKQLNTGASFGMSDAEIIAAAKSGKTLEQLIREGAVNPYGNWGGMRGFADGGVGDFGSGTMAMLHGEEAIIPLDRFNEFGSGVTNNFYVNGTGREVADTVSRELMRQLKLRRRYGTA